MASIKTIVFLFTVLVPAMILAQSPKDTSIIPVENSEALSPSVNSKPPTGFHWPSWLFGFSSEDAVSRPTFSGSDESNPDLGVTDMPTHSRQKRRVIQCNFASQGSLACHSCHEVRRCYPMNYGTITTCSGALRYCNRGRCSSTQGGLCKATASTSSTTESTSTSTGDSTSTSSSSTSSSTSTSTSTSSSTSSTTTSTTTSAP